MGSGSSSSACALRSIAACCAFSASARCCSAANCRGAARAAWLLGLGGEALAFEVAGAGVVAGLRGFHRAFDLAAVIRAAHQRDHERDEQDDNGDDGDNDECFHVEKRSPSAWRVNPRCGQSLTLAFATMRVGMSRTRISPGTALRRPNSSARSAPM